MDASQFTGQGDDTITLNGWIAPELTGTLYSLDVLRLMADTGKAWILIQGTGRILGNFVITNLTEGRTHFTRFGEAARVEFSICLKRVEVSEHNRLAILGDINSVRLDKLMGGV
jgi:hypothetical protein